MGTMWMHGLRLLTMAALLTPGAARADFHKWEIAEVFTNADGTVQFIEFFTDDLDPQHLLASEETVSIVTNGQTFVFPTDLPGPQTGDRRMLIGTPAFAALPGAPTPDYTIPANFFSTSSGVLIQYIDEGEEIDSDSPDPLPTDGILSWNRPFTLLSSPTNYAGSTGSVAPLIPPPVQGLRVAKATPTATQVDIEWDVMTCTSVDFHLIYGDLIDVALVQPDGSVCGLGQTGQANGISLPSGDRWFLVIANDGVDVEGSWGDGASGPRNGSVPSASCGVLARDNGGTCP